jgi:urease accessory protein
MNRGIHWRSIRCPLTPLRMTSIAGLALLTLGYSMSAQAHIQAGETGGFLSGVKHPLSGLDHVVAMVSVGLWGAQLGKPAIWALPVTFPLVMAVGGFLGLVGIPLPGVEVGIAASAILLGAAVLCEARPPLSLAAVLVGTFAIFHGYAHGAELPPGDSGLLYSLGFIVATGFLHGCGIAGGLIHRWRWGQQVLRLAGGAVLAAGGVFLWKAL